MIFKMEGLLKHYWENNYTVEEVTAALDSKHGIVYRVRHVQRLLTKFGLKRRANQSPVDDITTAIVQELASGSERVIGIRPMQYRLQKKYHLNMSRQTVNDLLKILTPAALLYRRASRLTRRVYSVKGPNHMWHCDGYDKLKPFGICIHDAIDGWSRRLLWLNVARTNNDPKVICTYYMRTVRELEFVPRILRLDAGTENGKMADVHYLLRQEHNDQFARSCVIIGKSVHNERIKRFWSYLGMVYTRSCANLFKDMRDSGILDVSNVLHIECLRFCFIPVIQADLVLVMETWNDHRIRKQTTHGPAGRPSFMFNCPDILGFPDMSMHVDLSLLRHCEEIVSVNLPDMGASDEFSELALEMMLMHDLQLATTVHNALELFVSLVEVMEL